MVHALVGLAESGVSDEQFADAVRFWKERAEEHLAPRRVQPHSLVASLRLFGGGDVHMSLAPVAFETFMTAIDAFCQDPDPKDSPYQRTLSERRADAADDLAHFGLTHGGASDQGCGHAPDNDDLLDDVFDGTTPNDTNLLDELLDPDTLDRDDGDDLDANSDAELFTDRQRRAIAARDRHCVLPGCRRPPRHCDTHHLHERNNNGPTVVANGCLLCRHHHRLLHQYEWRLNHDADGAWIATDPHGTGFRERKPSDSDAA